MSGTSANLTFGLLGQDIVADQDPHTGQFFAFQVIEDCVVADMEWEEGYHSEGDLKWDEFTVIAAGITLVGRFTMIELASGSGIAFKASEQ